MTNEKLARIRAKAVALQSKIEKIGKVELATVLHRNEVYRPEVVPATMGKTATIHNKKTKCVVRKHSTPHSAKCEVYKVVDGVKTFIKKI